MDAEDETMHLQLVHLASEGRKATGADLAAFIIAFWDEKVKRKAYACVSAHKDGVGSKQMADTIYAVLMTAQTMLDSVDQELILRDRKTGETFDFAVFKPHNLDVPDDE